jgi:hypothetical protein
MAMHERGASFSTAHSAQAAAYPRNNAVPLTLVGGGIVHHDAVYESTTEVAAVVPNEILAEAGYSEKQWGNPLVDDVGGRVLPR